MPDFKVVSPFEPQGDQPQAIDILANGVKNGDDVQVLLGVTGSGKTYTMAKVIERVQKPTLVIAHNKTLAAQLCSEFREFFPNNAVEYFVSYYDYYQPEAYIASSDTYIEKTADINDEIDRLRHSATCSLNERKDVIIVASVSCIYALGSPEDYMRMSISIRKGMTYIREDLMRKLVDIQYQRNDFAFERGNFRVRGDVIEIFPMNLADKAIRVEFFGDEVDAISEINVVTGVPLNSLSHAVIFPATHYATSKEAIEKALEEIAKSKEENQIRTAKAAIKEAEYNNLKTVLRLRNQRRLAKIDKKLATDTQELLFGLVGKKDEKGTFVPGTLTPVEYEKKRDELKEQANKDRKEADKVFQEEVKELQTKFPDYWCYDNSWDKQIYGTRW